jgi:hypothetical protein
LDYIFYHFPISDIRGIPADFRREEIRTSRTEQTEQYKWNRIDITREPEQVSKNRKPERESEDRTASKGLLGQDYQAGTARTGQPEYIEPLEQDSQTSTVRKEQPG